MGALQQWAFSVCSAMVACGIAGLVLPKGNLEKMFRLTVSIFFLCCLLSPILLPSTGLGLDIRITPEEEIHRRAQAVTDVVERQSDVAAQRNLEKIIGEKLTEMGINYGDMTINIKTNGQSSSQVETVEIVLDRTHEARHQEIRSELQDAFGLNFRLGYTALAGEEG